MGSLGAPEILVILVVALLVLGPERLPEAARQVGRAVAEMRRMSSGFQAEIRDAMQTPVAGPPVPPPSPSPASAPASDSKFLWSDLPTSSSDDA
ncbi:MAG TPA: Sec-independent protein translocase protein TatB [Acidimicrobiales bacterium]|nr:Sec-independent protein translocase protein TatB [Acidimicrobiales bacterium]